MSTAVQSSTLTLRSLHHYRITINHGGCVACLFSRLLLVLTNWQLTLVDKLMNDHVNGCAELYVSSTTFKPLQNHTRLRRMRVYSPALFLFIFLKTSFSQFLALGESREAVHVTEMLARKSTQICYTASA